MTITVYGRPSCVKCEACKDKLHRMNFKYDFVDINLLFAADETTEEIQREKREVMAEYQLYDPQTLPLVLIDSKWYTYPEAMAFLKKNHSQ